tara:strand:- start:31 stop:324 length:294 start_codon:yes stop_codon:yes gene_type:complete
MAVGAFTITTGSRVSLGNATQISGTIEIGSDGAASDIFPSGYILSFSLDSNVDGFGTAVPKVIINSGTEGGDGDNGSVWCDSETAGPETFNWTAVFI